MTPFCAKIVTDSASVIATSTTDSRIDVRIVGLTPRKVMTPSPSHTRIEKTHHGKLMPYSDLRVSST